MERIWELCVRRRELHSTCGALWQKKWSCDCIEMESIVSAFQKIAMQKEKRGVWSYQTERYLHGVYYDYQIPWDGEIVELGDPYARGCGVNGIRSMVVDLNRTNPLQIGSMIKDRKKKGREYYL